MPSQPLPLQLLQGDKMGDETDYRDALAVNMSGILKPIFDAKGYMLQQPGLTQYGTGVGICRATFYNDRLSCLFQVSGESFIDIDVDGATNTLGTVLGNDTATLGYSFDNQLILANKRYYLYNPSDGFREVTDPELGDPLDLVWINNYVLFTDGETIYHTRPGLDDEIEPLDFATSEFSPDASLGVGKTVDNKWIVFNRYSTEYFILVTTENFAWQRIPTRALKVGIVGTHGKVEIGDQWYVLGGRREESISVHVLGVGTAQSIASREIDKLIGKYTEDQLSKVVLEARVEDKYPYLIVHLPDETLLFNINVAQAVGNDAAWTIIKTDVLGDNPWRGKHGVFEPRKGVWVYGDKRDDTIGILDNTVATHYGAISEWLLYTPFMYLEAESIDEIQIEIIPGFTSNADATVFCSLTYNGVTYGSEKTLEYGQPSAYSNRFIAYRFGYVRDWVGIKYRGATRSRMAFSRGFLIHG